MELRERVRSVELETPATGSFDLRLRATVDGSEGLPSLGLEVGNLHFVVPLERGRFNGRVDVGGGRTRVSVRARGRRVRASVRGTVVDGAGGVLGLDYISGCTNEFFWDGTIYGMHPVTVQFGDCAVQGVLGTVGRSAWPPKPKWDYADLDENEVASVRLEGAAVFPSIPGEGPILLVVPEANVGPWNGRVRGCALAVDAVPRIMAGAAAGTLRTIDPINGEALDFGPGVAVAPGIQVLDSAGVPVYQALFDSAIPEAIARGQWCLVAATSVEEPAAQSRRVKRIVTAPVARPLRDLELDVQVLEVREDGAVWGWGGNYRGEIGDGTKRLPTGPVPSLVPASATSVAAGYGFSLAVDGDGRVWRWGGMFIGDYDYPVTISSVVPVVMSDLPTIKAVAAGDRHALALDASGRVWAWGANDLGQLGDGAAGPRSRRPVLVLGMPRVERIVAGRDLSLAIDAEGRVWGWGDFLFRHEAEASVPVLIPGLPLAKEIAADGAALVLALDGTVWAWGPNYYGEVGDGTTDRRETPVPVVGLDGVVALDAGDFHSIALRDDGTVWAWGENSEGQLGDGASLNQSVPVKVRDLVRIVRVGAADFKSLALDADGRLWGWGQLLPLATGAVGTRRGGSGIYPHLLPRAGDGRYIKE